ncbi:MAG: sigma-54-dependent Fis family transcriptional regulator [Planctomycetia bacterium]|nr:sigma-54-dependent Fis family transcriptional regulator [Planctomycetia bacterium]
MTASPTILLVEDEDGLREALAIVLRRAGYQVFERNSAAEGLRAIDRESPDVVVTDLAMENPLSGMDVLRHARQFSPATETILMTAFGTIENAVECMRLGAFHYITKPINSEELELLVAKAVEHRRLVAENRNLRQRVKDSCRFDNIVGASPAMSRLFEQITRVAALDTTVLLNGETGTGKELVAHAIHDNSPRAPRSFVAINCGALPESLLESELFGYVRGAFTGASTNKKGLFEEADGGTFFLDEISAAPMSIQVKLLRVLEERETRRIGDTRSTPIDVRIIAASNRDLQAEVAAGRVRDDLFYRLNVVSLRLPPLRERREDIPLLAQHFVQKYATRFHRPTASIDPAAMRIVTGYEWPGNVRELENVMERAVALGGSDRVGVEDLPPELSVRHGSGAAVSEVGVVMTLEDAERECILWAVKRCEGNLAQAAKGLGIGRTTLWRKLKRYGVQVGEDEGGGAS